MSTSSRLVEASEATWADLPPDAASRTAEDLIQSVEAGGSLLASRLLPQQRLRQQGRHIGLHLTDEGCLPKW